MSKLPTPLWTKVRGQLREVLETLDEHDETLVAAHLAVVLDCLEARPDTLQAGNS